jgi:hypothetical protein
LEERHSQGCEFGKFRSRAGPTHSSVISKPINWASAIHFTGERSCTPRLQHGRACRCTELAKLRLADVEWVKEALRITIRRGRTDEEAAGAIIATPEGSRLRPKALLDA